MIRKYPHHKIGGDIFLFLIRVIIFSKKYEKQIVGITLLIKADIDIKIPPSVSE